MFTSEPPDLSPHPTPPEMIVQLYKCSINWSRYLCKEKRVYWESIWLCWWNRDALIRLRNCSATQPFCFQLPQGLSRKNRRALGQQHTSSRFLLFLWYMRGMKQLKRYANARQTNHRLITEGRCVSAGFSSVFGKKCLHVNAMGSQVIMVRLSAADRTKVLILLYWFNRIPLNVSR